MDTSVVFIDDTQVKVTTKAGEELQGYLRIAPAVSNFQKQKVIDIVKHAFDSSDNLVEASNFISLAPERLTMGMIFEYITPPSLVRRKQFGAQLKALRKSKGFTLREFAFLIQMDPSNYSRIELGKHSASIDTLNKIAYYLDAEVKLVSKECESRDHTHRVLHYE